MKRFNKFLALFLAVVITVGMLPAGVSAAENSNVVLDESFESWADANTVITNDYSVRGGTTSWNGATPAEGWSISVNEGQVLVQPVLGVAQDGNVSIKLTPNKDTTVSSKNRAKLSYRIPTEDYAAMEDGAEYIFTVYFKGENETVANIEVKTYVEGVATYPNPNYNLNGSNWTKVEYKFVLDKAKNAERNYSPTIDFFMGIKWHGDNVVVGDLYIDNVSIVKAQTPYEEMVSDLAAKDTVALTGNADGTGNDLIVKTGKTLDLAGYTLTVDSLSAMPGAKVTDSVGGGKIVVANDNLTLQADNGMLPIKTNEGYVLSNVKLTNNEVEDDGLDDIMVYETRPSLGAANNAAYLADGAADNGLSIIIRLTWTNASNGTTTTMDVPCSEELIKDIYGGTGAFRLLVKGVDGVENLKVATVITSTTGVTCVSVAQDYTAPAV